MTGLGSGARIDVCFWEGVGGRWSFSWWVPGSLELRRRDVLRKLVGRARSLYSEAMQKNSNKKVKR